MKIYIAHMYEVQEAKEMRLCSMLDSNRARKVSGFRNRKERMRCIFAGLLLRYAFLQEGYGPNAWQQIEVVEGDYGKPYLKGYPAFHYNLSHSGEWVACAVDTVPVGIDIQEMKSWKMTLAKRFYYEEEYNRLLALQESDMDRQTKEFYSMWTAKESAVKWSGRGIGGGIRQLLTDADYKSICDIDLKQRAKIRQYRVSENYIVCVCSENDNFPDLPQQVDLE